MQKNNKLQKKLEHKIASANDKNADMTLLHSHDDLYWWKLSGQCKFIGFVIINVIQFDIQGKGCNG